MTDFSTLDNTIDSSQPSLLLFRNKWATSNNIPIISRSLSPKAKRNLAFPQQSLLKDILQSYQEDQKSDKISAKKISKIPKNTKKIPISAKQLLVPSEILNFSSNSIKTNGLRSNVLCLFNNDLKVFLEKRAENAKLMQEVIIHKDELVFLHMQTQYHRQLSHIFEELLLKEKDLIFRDLLRTVKREMDEIIREFNNFINIPKPKSAEPLQPSKKMVGGEEIPSFEKCLDSLLTVYDIELNEKSLFGILRPEKPDFEAIISRYQRFSSDEKEKKALAEKIQKKFAEDLDSIVKLKKQNSLLAKENEEVGVLREKVEKDSGETFRLVQERLKLMELRNLEKALVKEKGNDKREEFQNNFKNFNMEEKLRLLLDEKDALASENLGLKQYNEILLKKNSKLQLQIKKIDLKKDKICMNKETEVKYFTENYQNKPIKSLRYLLHYPGLILQTPNFSYKWCLILINLIYTHKILQDVVCEFESSSPKSLKELILDFFVTKFKSKFLIEAFLRDFINNLKKYSPFSLRIKTFCHLSGLIIDPPKLSLDTSNEDLFPYNSVKNAVLSSKFSSEAFLRLIYHIRANLTSSNNIIGSNSHNAISQANSKMNNTITQSNNGMINGGVNTSNSINSGFVENVMGVHKSFLSFEDDEAFGVETAKNLIPILINLEGMGENSFNNLEETFQNALETDLYERITNFNEEVMTIQNKHSSLENNNSNAIRVDFYLKFLLDHIIEKKMGEFQRMYTLIKLQKVNKPELFFNFKDFNDIVSEVYPQNKNVKFLENSFIDLVDELTEDNHIHSTFKNLVLGSGDHNAKPNSSFFFNKIISIPNKQWKNTGEVAETCRVAFGDWRSELGIITETYKMFKSALFQASRNNQKFAAVHDEFLSEILKIHKNVLQAKNFDNNWVGADKVGFLRNLEGIWGRLVELLETNLKENGI